jgi:hypothetical protein
MPSFWKLVAMANRPGNAETAQASSSGAGNSSTFSKSSNLYQDYGVSWGGVN